MAIKILIVDDSALMRRQLVEVFKRAGEFEIRTARNGQEAIEENLSFEPDVITLDINMPVMDGLTALAHIMAQRPVPVVMVSSLTEKGALATFEALALGAVDYVAKPGGTISLSIEEIKQELITKVRVAARAKLRGRRGFRGHPRGEQGSAPKPSLERWPDGTEKPQGLVLIGSSTGGPSTLELILPSLPGDYPFPIIVAQHMPASFTGPFASRMDNLCALKVVEVREPMELKPCTVYIARGGADVVLTNRSDRAMVVPRPESKNFIWHPSVEILGQSALEHWEPEKLIGVMLTGMGYDGAEAFAEIKRRGGRTIAESEESAVVFGMPKELIARGGASLVLPAQRISGQLIGWARR